MAKKESKKKIGESPDLNPMIDVVFQLLIFFMVTAVFAITPGLDIKLPEAEESQAPEKENLCALSNTVFSPVPRFKRTALFFSGLSDFFAALAALSFGDSI